MTLSEAIRSGQSSREVMKLEKIAVGSPFSLFCRGQVRGPKLLDQMNVVSKPFLFSNPVVCGGRGKGERGEWGHPCVRTDGWPSKRPRI